MERQTDRPAAMEELQFAAQGDSMPDPSNSDVDVAPMDGSSDATSKRRQKTKGEYKNGKRLSFAARAEIIALAESKHHKLTRKQIAAKFGITSARICQILNEKERRRVGEELERGICPTRKRVCTPKYAALEQRLLQWIKRGIVFNNLPGYCGVRNPLAMSSICSQAKVIAKEMDLPQFTASNGWFTRFKERYGLSELAQLSKDMSQPHAKAALAAAALRYSTGQNLLLQSPSPQQQQQLQLQLQLQLQQHLGQQQQPLQLDGTRQFAPGGSNRLSAIFLPQATPPMQSTQHHMYPLPRYPSPLPVDLASSYRYPAGFEQLAYEAQAPFQTSSPMASVDAMMPGVTPVSLDNEHLGELQNVAGEHEHDTLTSVRSKRKRKIREPDEQKRTAEEGEPSDESLLFLYAEKLASLSSAEVDELLNRLLQVRSELPCHVETGELISSVIDSLLKPDTLHQQSSSVEADV